MTKETISEAKAAATVMLLRDKPNETGIEVLMLQRHDGADFGGAFVFPGGLAASADYARQLEPFCCGLDDAVASKQLGLEAGGLGLWVAAIRECFEESGYLLARDFEGLLCQPGDDANVARFADYRRALAGGSLTLLEVCKAESLTLMCSAMEYVSFWTTPEPLKRRYATRFFVAAVPEGQHGVADGYETVSSRWVCPIEATKTKLEQELHLHPPTTANLEWLAAYSSVDAAMAAATAFDKAAIREILPVIERSGDSVNIVIPDVDG